MVWVDEAANGSIIGFVVAVGVFGGVFIAVTQTAVEAPTPLEVSEQSNYEAIARGLGEALVQPGRDWYLGNEDIRCLGGTENPAALTPDAVGRLEDGQVPGRFGLGAECSGPSGGSNVARLSYSKIANLYQAEVDASDNGHVDYEEARRSLDLGTDAVDLHVRTAPILSSVQDVLGGAPADTLLKAAYIGDYFQESAGGPGPPLGHVGGVNVGSDRITPWIEVSNTGSTETTLMVEFDVALSRGTIHVVRHLPRLDAGESYTASVELRKSRDWAWASTGTAVASATQALDYTISDVSGAIATGSISLSSINMDASTRHNQLFVTADQLSYEPGGAAANLVYASYKGDGRGDRFSDWTLRVMTEAGTPEFTPDVLSSTQSGTLSYAFATEGGRMAQLEDDGLATVWNLDVINVYAEAPLPFTSEIAATPALVQPSTLAEAGYLDVLVDEFTPAANDALYAGDGLTFAADGDVFPDVASVVGGELASRLLDDHGTADPADDTGDLDEYNVLVIGSNVDHAKLALPEFPRAVNAWVAAGGTLLVFGSSDQSFDWLEGLSGAGIVTANGGLYTPDESHPVLTGPNVLDYIAYIRYSTWVFDEESSPLFTHVLLEESADPPVDLLAVSNAGSFGLGRVVLTGFRPYDLTSDQAVSCAFPLDASCQSVQLLQNLLTQGYRQLLLDFGPPIPTDQPTGAWQTLVLVDHPDLGEAVVARLSVYAFPAQPGL